MAKVLDLTAEWEEWIKSKPQVIQDLAKRLPPDRLYLLKSSGHRVELHGYVEDGTLIVRVLGKWNKIMFERNVFGIKPEDLVECDVPGPEEPLGVTLVKDEEIERYIDLNREEILKGGKEDDIRTNESKEKENDENPKTRIH